MTHKSFSAEQNSRNANLRDYERLEFLGDSILGYLIAQYFFLTTQESGSTKNLGSDRMNPKELHRMKAALVNNNLLSLIVIESEINDYMIYNDKNEQFKEQMDKYASEIKKITSI